MNILMLQGVSLQGMGSGTIHREEEGVVRNLGCNFLRSTSGARPTARTCTARPMHISEKQP